ncbi:MAG: hypothetical protein EOM80_00470 [Erysipelotrichia bacterium]|nr:hypothetical protein [Candidatus Riflebacteria bacterium]NCB37216.1 hypothetical protein [Erysipelotrichia bacterium]
MKFQFDLLPKEYKSLPRDIISMAIAFIAILTTLSAVGSMSFKNRGELVAAQKTFDSVETELREVIDKTGKIQPPISEITSLKSSIDFINRNLDTPGTSWVDFLATLEAAVPERVLITDLSPKNFNNMDVNFTLNGEASSIFDALEFEKRLKQSGKFKSMLKSNTEVSGANGSIQKFIIEFSYIAPGRK